MHSMMKSHKISMYHNGLGLCFYRRAGTVPSLHFYICSLTKIPCVWCKALQEVLGVEVLERWHIYHKEGN